MLESDHRNNSNLLEKIIIDIINIIAITRGGSYNLVMGILEFFVEIARCSIRHQIELR